MKNTTDNTPTIRVKKKYAILVSEYCIENSLEFTVSPKLANKDEFDINFNIEDINAAISLGIFFRENRIDYGNATATSTTISSSTPKKKTKKSSAKTESTLTTSATNGFAADTKDASNALTVKEDAFAFDLDQNN